MSYIVSQIMEKYLNNVKTTKDLIYKDKIIDPHNIQKSYEAKEWPKSFLIFGNNHYYYNANSFKWMTKLTNINFHLRNLIAQNHEKTEKFLHDRLDKFLISEVQNSLWIEGVKSSKKQIKQFLKEEFKEKNASEEFPKIVNNYWQALKLILSTENINEEIFFSMYNILTKDVNMGSNKLDGYPYRQNDVEIGNEHNLGIAANMIKKSMDKIFELFNWGELDSRSFANEKELIHHDFWNAILIHLNFEHIHPYYDMNGRMGRLLTVWYLKNKKLLSEGFHFSEAINLFKNQLYYGAFNAIEEKEFKFDASYFVSSIIAALVAHKICYLNLKMIANNIKNKHKKKINGLQEDILISLLAKEQDKFYQTQDLILGVDSINPAQISKAFAELVEFSIIEEINSKPKEYKLIWTSEIKNNIKKYLESN